MPRRLKQNIVGPALAILLLSFAAALAAQTPQPSPPDTFSAASIKPDSNPTGRYVRMESATELIVHNHTLRTLLAEAYSLSPDEVLGGPSLVDSEHWSIVAKTPAPRPTHDQQMAMLRQLMADRFQVRSHREPKQMTVLAITVAAAGPKLKPSTLDPNAYPAGPPPLIFVVTLPTLKLNARYATMGDLAALLRHPFEKPVVDQTGLTGHYDFDLEFVPGETLYDGAFKDAVDPSKPDVFAAMRDQLGLKLSSTKGTVNTLVIDHAEMPSAN